MGDVLSAGKLVQQVQGADRGSRYVSNRLKRGAFLSCESPTSEEFRSRFLGRGLVFRVQRCARVRGWQVTRLRCVSLSFFLCAWLVALSAVFFHASGDFGFDLSFKCHSPHPIGLGQLHGRSSTLCQVSLHECVRGYRPHLGLPPFSGSPFV